MTTVAMIRYISKKIGHITEKIHHKAGTIVKITSNMFENWHVHL